MLHLLFSLFLSFLMSAIKGLGQRGHERNASERVTETEREWGRIRHTREFHRPERKQAGLINPLFLSSIKQLREWTQFHLCHPLHPLNINPASKFDLDFGWWELQLALVQLSFQRHNYFSPSFSLSFSLSLSLSLSTTHRVLVSSSVFIVSMRQSVTGRPDDLLLVLNH